MTEVDRRQIGTVSELWRYPVKSMLGEKRPELEITTGGAIGDRAWALRERATGRIASAKKWPGLFHFSAAYRTEPSLESAAEADIAFADGRVIGTDDPNVSEVLSAALGRKMKLERVQDAKRERAAIDPTTVFADVPVEQVIPAFTAQTLPDTFGLPAGTFFDEAPIHLVATGTLAHMRDLCDPEAKFENCRFRANIFVRTDLSLTGFVEDDWVGGTLILGETIKITGIYPALRCVMTTLPQGGLPHDPRILRTAARHHKAHVGVFAVIEAGGIVRLGDPVFLLK